VIFILKCDGAGCDERVVLDERHVNGANEIVNPPAALEGWCAFGSREKQLNGEARPGMTTHRCPACMVGMPKAK